MTITRLIACGLAALALVVDAAAKENTAPSAGALFPGVLDMPVAEGSDVPRDCAFPDSFKSAANLDLACVVTTGAVADDDVDVEYIAWLGANGFRHSADIIGGFSAVRVRNGCEQVLNVFPHSDDASGGIWFALERQPRCAAPTAAQ